MRRGRAILNFAILVFCLAAAGRVWGADASFCLGCHQERSISKQDDHGRDVSLYVSEVDFRRSVHSRLSCTDCHTRIKDDFHAAGGKNKIPQADCGMCHEKAAKEYRQSLHGTAVAKGDDKAAHCYDCHGKHNVFRVKDGQSLANEQNINKTCNRCHSNKEIVRQHALGGVVSPGELFVDSVHAKTGAVTCVSCHGGHNVRAEIDPQSAIFRSNVPRTCGECHPDVMKEFVGSVHGVLEAKGRSGSPTCTTCHGVHGIKAKIDPESPVNEKRIALTTCPQCHAAERISKEYGITRGLVKSYYDSFHGLSYRGGDTFSANCASCHGVHDIRSSSDPKSMIHKDNLQKTCGVCHPGASANFAKGKMHSVASITGGDIGEKAVGWVRIVYLILIGCTIGGMTFFNFTDWLRKTIDRKPR
jgi:hypothetical protein